MNDRSCPELRAAALGGRHATDEDHVRTCAVCAGERAAMDEIGALVRALDPPLPSSERLDEIRGRLLALPDPRPVARPRAPRWAWGAVGAAAAAAVVVVGLSLYAPSAVEPGVPELRAHVQSAASTRFVHHAAREAEPERVELSEGSIHLEIEPLAPSERFVVATDDAEVEGRGTVVEVVALDGQLTRVHVVSGKVEVRWRGAPEVQLGAGQTWTPPARVREPVLPPSPAPAVSVEPAPAPSEAPRLDKPKNGKLRASERAFRDAWATFARGDMARAAELFAEVERLAPDSALAEDALYGLCTALERADRRDEAVAELRRYLVRYPSGSRADEVALALAAFEAEAGAREEAERLYTRALASPVDTIRSRARAGLDALR